MIRFVILFYLVGCLIFISMAKWGVNYWTPAYYLWDKGKDLLLFVTILLLVKKQYKFIVSIVLAYSIIRFSFEIYSATWLVNMQNSALVSTLFLSLIIGVITLMIYDFLITKRN